MPVGLGAMVAMSAVPAVVQGVQGFIQSGKARKMLDNLERPQYEIPQSVMQGTQRAINAASSFQMPGQDAYQQSIDQASSGALYNITQNATSGPEALAAMTGVYGAQMGAQNQMALAAAQDYQRRDQLAQQALMTRGEYEDKAWMTNVYQPYAEEAQAASALAEAGKINAYQAVKGLAGVGANAVMMKSLGMFDTGTGTGTNKVAQATSPTNADPNFISKLNPNFQGVNKYGQPQFNNSVSRYSSFVPNMGITSKPNQFVPMMGDANVISNTGENTGIMFNNIPGVTDGLTESPLINQQPFNNVVSQITGRNSFTVGTTNSGGVGALNVTPPVVSNTAPVQPTAVIPSQPAPVVPAPVVTAPVAPAPAIVSPGFAQAQQTMNAVEAGAIQAGDYTKDQMQAQDVAAAAAAAPSTEPVVAPEVTAPAVPPAPEIKKITPLEATSLMVSRLPASIIKSSPSLQKFAEQNVVSTDPQKNTELAYQELHDSIVNTDKFKSEGPVHPDALRRFSGLTIERDKDGDMKYEWVKDSKGKWVVQDYDPTVGRKLGESEIAYTDANGNLVHPEDPIRVLDDLGSVYHSNWKKTDGSLDTEALDKLKKIGFTTEELGRLLVGNDRFASKNANTNTLSKEFPDYFNKENNSDTPKERQNIKTSTPQYNYFIDDILTKGFKEVNRLRGTNFTIEDEKKAIESYFKEGKNLENTDKFNKDLKETLKGLKKSDPVSYRGILDNEGNYIGSDNATKNKEKMTYKSQEMVGSTAQGNRRSESFTKEVPLPLTNNVVDWRAAVNDYHNSEECREGKCFSSWSAHSPAYFAIPMLGDLIDQEGYFKDIDDLNEKRGTSLSPKDQKNAIEFLFKEDLSEDEKKWLEMATHPKGSLQGVKNKMKPKLKALKEEYPDLYADIVDDEGNYIGGNK
jgi:hypothetical protein